MSDDSPRVFILTTKLNFDSQFSEADIEEFSASYFDLVDAELTVPIADWIDKDAFDEEFDNIRAWAKDKKNKLKGCVFAFVSEGDETYTIKYKVSTTKITCDRCEINITERRPQKEKAKALTEDEKIEMFRKYWDEKNKLPSKSEVYKGFRIGTFYHTVLKNSGIAEQLNKITNE